MRGFCLFRRITAAAALAAVFLAIVPGTAGAYHRDRERELQDLMDKKRSQISQLDSREDDLLAKLNESSARQAKLEAELRSIDARLAIAQRQLAGIERRLDRVTAELLAKTRALEETQAALDLRSDALDGRVAEMYMSAPDVITNVVDAATGVQDMVVAAGYVERVVEDDRVLLDEIEVTKAELEAQRVAIEVQRAALAEDRAAARATAQEIAAKRAARASTVVAVQREVGYQRYLLGELRSQKEHFQQQLRRYERESQEIAEFLRGVQGGQTAIQGRGGWLKWPVSGNITSDYGWRTHPVYKRRAFHTGIDIGAGQGTTVKAARIGNVVKTGWYGAYGLVVILDHGSGVATMYCHLSQTYVSTGEHVSTLEPVGAVGSTGYSTGPHLHFEVRVNGEHTDPMRWL